MGVLAQCEVAGLSPYAFGSWRCGCAVARLPCAVLSSHCSHALRCWCGTCACSFEKRVYISLPEHHARMEMFRIHIGDTGGIRLTEDDLARLADLTDGCG